MVIERNGLRQRGTAPRGSRKPSSAWTTEHQLKTISVLKQGDPPHPRWRKNPVTALFKGNALEARVAKLLHQRLGFDRLLKEEVPPVVYLDEHGRLFSAPVAGGARSTLRFKLIGNSIEGIRYSLLLYHGDFQFTVSHRDGKITLHEDDAFSEADKDLLKRLFRYLERTPDWTLVRRLRSNKTFWQRLFERRPSTSE